MQRPFDILGAVLGAGVLLAGVASAASLGMTTTGLGAGSAAVSRCVSSSLSATRNVDNSGTVTQVTVTNVPQACSGQTLSVTLVGSGGAGLGSASATIGACGGGCAVGLSGFGTVSAASLRGYAFSVRG